MICGKILLEAAWLVVLACFAAETFAVQTRFLRPEYTVVSVEFNSPVFAGSEMSGFVKVSLELVGGSSAEPFNVTVTPSQLSPVSARGDGENIDFDSTPLTATFGKGDTMTSVMVAVVNDMLAEEGNEMFNLTLTVPSSLKRIVAGARSNAVGTIIDTTMLKVGFTSGQFVGSESSGSVEVEVTISGGSSTKPIRVMVIFYRPENSYPLIVTFAAGETNKTISIPVVCDKVVERIDRFTIRLRLLSYSYYGRLVTTGIRRSVGIISDSTVEVNFNQSSYTVREGDKLTVNTVMNRASTDNFTVTINLKGDTALVTKDFRRSLMAIDIPAGVTTHSFTVGIVNDDIVECDETFNITIVAVTTCGVVIGRVSMTKVTITDNDGAVLSFNQSEYSVDENMTPLSVGLTLTGITSEDVIVSVAIIDKTAKVGRDYSIMLNGSSSVRSEISFPAGRRASSSLITVEILDNAIIEGNRNFSIEIRRILQPTCLDVSVSLMKTVVTIIDDEGDSLPLLGYWCNELGSLMWISSTKGLLAGWYNTNVGHAKHWYTLRGTYNSGKNGSTVAWTVTYNNKYGNSYSTCAWSGQIQQLDGAPIITTSWLLTKQTKYIDNWESTVVNKDVFKRCKPARVLPASPARVILRHVIP